MFIKIKNHFNRIFFILIIYLFNIYFIKEIINLKKKKKIYLFIQKIKYGAIKHLRII
jgi:hypothetical protein